ncbi:MAG: hypothetical protein RLZZ436_2494 [Planctomycetota bacterium]|jgi:hypothetical protein
MLLVKKLIGGILIFLAAFLMVVGVGRSQAAGSAALLPVILGLVFVFGGTGLWLVLSKPGSQTPAR